MSLKLLVIMDPLSSIQQHKDSTLAMLEEAASRGWSLRYTSQGLSWEDGRVLVDSQALTLPSGKPTAYQLSDARQHPIEDVDVVLFRLDPPCNAEYLYQTWLLEQAEKAAVVVINRPQGLRLISEKLALMHFPALIPPTCVTRSKAQIVRFLEQHPEAIIKPLDGMGGRSVFKLDQSPNQNVIIDTVTQQGQTTVMVQRFIPAITQGDKRILMLMGEPLPYALARVPAHDDFRGNLAAGACPHVVPLTAQDQAIAQQVGPWLLSHGIYFAGLDVIGDYLTEINVTSPTGIREIERGCSLNVAEMWFSRLIESGVIKP